MATLAIERRGGRDGGVPLMSARPIKRLLPWNKGLLVGQKKPLEPKHVWSIRVRLEIARSRRDLAIFNLAIDSKLRACDLVRLRGRFVRELMSGDEQLSCKRRQADLSSSRSRSLLGVPLKPGCQCFGLPAPDFFSQVDFMRALTYQLGSMPGWCTAGSRASASSGLFTARTR